MKSQKWFKLLVALLFASVLIIGAVQRFDTIQAKKVIVTGSGGLVLGVSSGALDLNGKQLILDTDADTSLTADTDDQIDIEISGSDDFIFTANKFESQTGSVIDLNGTKLDLDADADTSLTADIDDTIDWEIGGSDVYSQTATNHYFNGQILTIDADQDTTLVASVDDVLTITLGAAGGHLDVATGNLKVGDGTPTFTQDGEDGYIEGLVEFGSDFVSGAQSTFTVDFAFPITPTGLYQPLDSADLGDGDGAAVTDIAAPTDDTIGKQLILHNINASQVITIDGTGATVECKTDVVLGAGDTLTLLWNGDDWNCLASYDNS